MYKIGDTIKIKKFSEDILPSHIVPRMEKYLGQHMVIKKTTYETCKLRYNLKDCKNSIDYWWWSENDFEDDSQMNIFERKDFEL